MNLCPHDMLHIKTLRVRQRPVRSDYNTRVFTDGNILVIDSSWVSLSAWWSTVAILPLPPGHISLILSPAVTAIVLIGHNNTANRVWRPSQNNS